MYKIDCLENGEGRPNRTPAGKTTKPLCLGSCMGLGVERRALGCLVGSKKLNFTWTLFRLDKL